MKGTGVAAVVASIFTLSSSAIELVKREASPAVIGLNIQRRSVSNPVQRDRLRRRQNSQTVTQTLDNFQGSLYFANVSIGTPPQDLRLHIDTGSSDLWTNSPTSRLCQLSTSEARRTGQLPCSISGTYDANSSSTYTYINSDFNISYVDGSGAVGDYVTDTLRIGGRDLQGLQFAVGYDSSSSEGVMGIGYPQLEVQVQTNRQRPYPNIPALMADQGLIQSNAYSLWLDDLDSSTGSILFGGVDTDKYQGQLSTLPIQPERGVFQELIIVMTGVNLVSNGQSQPIELAETGVLLDSGSTLTYLPPTTCLGIYNALNAYYNEQDETAYVDCSLQGSPTTIEFLFSGIVISVPMNELVLPAGTDAYGNPAQLEDGTLLCTFGIAVGSGRSGYTLGDTFLRSAYVVYDLANNEISLAQTNFNSVSSNVMAIAEGQNSVPDATGVASAASVQITGTNGGRLGGPSATGTVRLTASSSGGSPNPTGNSAGTARMPLGAFAGVAGAGLLLAL